VSPGEFCRDAAAPAGSNFHYATLFHPPAERRALYALFALRAEILRIAEDTPEPAVAALRRSWWLDELARAAARQARHPVGIELQDVIDQIGVGIRGLQRFAAAESPDTAAGGAIWEAAARACGVTASDAFDVVIRTGVLVDAVESLATGHPAAAAPESRATRLAELETQLATAVDEFARRGAVRAGFCRIMAGLSAVLCAEMQRDVALIGHARISLTPIRKLWIAWRIHHRGT